MAVGNKTIEITAIPKLLTMLDIENSIVRHWRVLDHLKALSVAIVNEANVTSIDYQAVHHQVAEDKQSCLADTVVMASYRHCCR